MLTVPRLAGLLMGALVAFASVLVWPAAAGATVGDASDASVTRFGGGDRYETSLQVAEAVAADAGGSLSSVVLVSGRRWTDAVVAATMAGSLGAPVLMTPPDELRADALGFLQQAGVSSAVVVGPDASGGEHGPGQGVDGEVLEALEAAGISVERVTGDDLYRTAVSAARRIAPGMMGDLGTTAVIASGAVFADALVAGPFAARGVHPVLLTPPSELHAETASYLSSARIEHVVLMGGTAALSEAVEQSIEDLDIDVTRVAGDTRYDTAVEAAELVENRYSDSAGRPCFASAMIGVARARVPFDSFSAAPLLGRLCAPLVLADPKQIPADTAAYLDAARKAHDTVGLQVFGGDAAVSQAAIDAYLTGETADTGDDDPAHDGEDRDAPGVLPAGTCGGAIDDKPRPLLDSDAAEDPAWSPDCRKIVYSHHGSLWTMNNDGTNPQRLTAFDGSYSQGPAWSPDSTQIAYARGRRNDDGHWFSHIYVVNADGTGHTKVSKGDVQDEQPSWSPDGSRIAFSSRSGEGRDEDGNFVNSTQHIVIVDADGTRRLTVTTGDHWHGSPAWSPDGRRIAYVSQEVVWLIDPDGTDAERVIGGAFWGGGLSWSPDGHRIAFARGDWDAASIIIADLDRPGEVAVTELSGFNASPRWSPDGDRIAFTHYPDGRSNAARFAHVTGASGTPTGVGDGCRPRGVAGTTAGFPLPRWATASTGTLRVAVLFMDFPDAEASHTTHEEAAHGLPYVEHYLESVSYGQLDVEPVAHHSWLRSEQPFASFVNTNRLGNQAVNAGAISHAVELAASDFDFSGIQSVMLVLAGNHFGGGGFAHDSLSAAGGVWPSSLINSVHLGQERAPYTWGSVAAHELSHSLGLADLYSYDDPFPDLAAPQGRWWIASEWGRMNMWAYFLVDAEDPRLAHDWESPNGGTSTAYRHHLRTEEMLAWSRWQLGWLAASQVRCIDDPEAEVALWPIAAPRDGVAMAAVPISSHELIVVESRRKLGYDAGERYKAPDSGASTTFPRLVTEGVLVYTVDSLKGTGDLPLRVAGDSGNRQVADFPVLEVGDSITVRGYTITVTADDGDTHTVSITRNN